MYLGLYEHWVLLVTVMCGVIPHPLRIRLCLYLHWPFSVCSAETFTATCFYYDLVLHAKHT